MTRAAMAPAITEFTERYGRPDLPRSLWQVANTFVPFFACLAGMFAALSHSYGVALLMAPVAAGLLVRIFVLQHDCGHHSLFHSARANDTLGLVCSLLTFIPYRQWRRQHNLHHAHLGKLDRRGFHCVFTLTVREYRDAPRWRRLGYRLFRNPVLLFGLGPLFYFLLLNRFAYGGSSVRPVERRSVIATNLAIAALYLGAAALLGAGELALVMGPVFAMASVCGFWLFYVQHAFEGTYFAHSDEWDYFRAALEGTSYYKLPRLLQWFTASIGLHHVHHLGPHVPNYHLQRCHDESPLLQRVPALGLAGSLRALTLALWDEERGELVRFRDLPTRERAAA